VDIDQLREFRKGVRKARSLNPESFEEDFDRNGIGGLDGI
jgi:hypothetical protein